MEELLNRLEKESRLAFNTLLNHAYELDKTVSPHMLIGIDEEGYMVKHPGPSEYVNKWLQELVNRKDFYSKKELKAWLLTERDQEIKHLEQAEKESYKKYYRYLLNLIRIELSSLIEDEMENQEASVKENVEALVRKDEIEEAMKMLTEYFGQNVTFEEEDIELIMLQARLAELEEM